MGSMSFPSSVIWRQFDASGVLRGLEIFTPCSTRVLKTRIHRIMYSSIVFAVHIRVPVVV